MKPEQEAELVDKMARAMNQECFEQDIVATYGHLWAFKQQEIQRNRARAALSIAKPIIRDEALEEAKTACVGEHLPYPEPNDDGDIAYDMAVRDCIAAVDALKSKGHKP